MIISNYHKINPLDIEFDLSLLEEKYKENDRFCLSLDIRINYKNKIYEHTNYVIDIESVERLIYDVKLFINEETNTLYYEPLEGDFFIYVPRPIKTIKEIICEMIQQGVDTQTINELKNSEDLHRLFFLFNEDKTGTGISYCLDITKNQMNEFIIDLEKKYMSLLKIGLNHSAHSCHTKKDI